MYDVVNIVVCVVDLISAAKVSLFFMMQNHLIGLKTTIIIIIFRYETRVRHHLTAHWHEKKCCFGNV
jgi:hypothetical protein